MYAHGCAQAPDVKWALLRSATEATPKLVMAAVRECRGEGGHGAVEALGKLVHMDARVAAAVLATLADQAGHAKGEEWVLSSGMFLIRVYHPDQNT